MPRSNLPLSPLLPLTPDWPSLAQECSRAYFALYRTIAAVRAGKADGHDYWLAHTRLEKAASVIAAWADPDLYGRSLARDSILAATCDNIANNTPQASCCDTCRYELGI
jgi:hypothetical protein